MPRKCLYLGVDKVSHEQAKQVQVSGILIFYKNKFYEK